MKRIFLLTIVLGLLALPVFAQKTETLTSDDKAQIIRLILEDGRVYKRYLFSDKKDSFITLSTENVDRSEVPSKIGETAIKLKTPQEIEDEKKTLRVYCVFGKFEIKNSTVKVSFSYYTKDSSSENFNQELLEYEYRKVDKNWKFVSRKHPGLFGR